MGKSLYEELKDKLLMVMKTTDNDYVKDNKYHLREEIINAYSLEEMKESELWEVFVEEEERKYINLSEEDKYRFYKNAMNGVDLSDKEFTKYNLLGVNFHLNAIGDLISEKEFDDIKDERYFIEEEIAKFLEGTELESREVKVVARPSTNKFLRYEINCDLLCEEFNFLETAKEKILELQNEEEEEDE